MINKKIINTDKAPEAIGSYSQAVLVNGWLYLSGQIPIDPATNKITEDNIVKQTERVLDNVKAVIESAGGTLENVVKTTVYLTDMNEFSAMNDIYSRYFPKTPPARATVAVSRLPKGVKVEIDAIAVMR